MDLTTAAMAITVPISIACGLLFDSLILAIIVTCAAAYGITCRLQDKFE